ncbi:MAG: hypothetical protein MJY59_05295 [Bacteroidaceae bacterium]|nr:hypothetical protein [Bacteroidaceae bacterium]
MTDFGCSVDGLQIIRFRNPLTNIPDIDYTFYIYIRARGHAFADGIHHLANCPHMPPTLTATTPLATYATSSASTIMEQSYTVIKIRLDVTKEARNASRDNFSLIGTFV